MASMADLFQTADWKSEKHVPVIECPDTVDKDTFFDVTVSLGKEISHPNTSEHHIRWIQLYFKPEKGKFAYQVGSFRFDAHGESVKGADTGPVYTDHVVSTRIKIRESGVLIATAFCNIHGFWESAHEIHVAE